MVDPSRAPHRRTPVLTVRLTRRGRITVDILVWTAAAALSWAVMVGLGFLVLALIR